MKPTRKAAQGRAAACFALHGNTKPYISHSMETGNKLFPALIETPCRLRTAWKHGAAWKHNASHYMETRNRMFRTAWKHFRYFRNFM